MLLLLLDGQLLQLAKGLLTLLLAAWKLLGEELLSVTVLAEQRTTRYLARTILPGDL
jgi:hypothetical protein